MFCDAIVVIGESGEPIGFYVDIIRFFRPTTGTVTSNGHSDVTVPVVGRKNLIISSIIPRQVAT